MEPEIAMGQEMVEEDTILETFPDDHLHRGVSSICYCFHFKDWCCLCKHEEGNSSQAHEENKKRFIQACMVTVNHIRQEMDTFEKYYHPYNLGDSWERMQFACYKGNLPYIQAGLAPDRHGNPSYLYNGRGCLTLLQLALIGNQLEAVRLLLKLGADPLDSLNQGSPYLGLCSKEVIFLLLNAIPPSRLPFLSPLPHCWEYDVYIMIDSYRSDPQAVRQEILGRYLPNRFTDCVSKIASDLTQAQQIQLCELLSSRFIFSTTTTTLG